jgi:DNA-binding NtrC family response regulator
MIMQQVAYRDAHRLQRTSGTNFVIEVTVSDALQGESMSPSHGVGAQTMDPRPVVLIVDADESSRTIYSELLQHAGFDTLMISTCEIGLQRLLHSTPAAVLVDPASCTDAIAGELLTIAVGRGIPILAVTSMGTAEDLAALTTSGYKAALLKPTILQDVLAAVQNATNVAREFHLTGT